MSQEFKSNLTGQFWLIVSHEVTVQVSAGATVFYGLTGAGRSTSNCHGWHFGTGRKKKASVSLHEGHSIGCLSVLTAWWMTSPKASNLRTRAPGKLF